MATVRLFSQTEGFSDVALLPPDMSVRSTLVSLQTTQPVLGPNGEEEILSFVFPFAPREITIDGLADEYAQLERPGRTPLVRFSKRMPITVGFTVLITNSQSKGILSAEENIIALSRIAQSQTNLIIAGLGPIVSSLRYRITEMSVSSKSSTPNNKISKADVSFTFVEVAPEVAPVPGMIKIADVSTGQPVTKPAQKKKKRTTGSPPGTTPPSIKWPEGRKVAIGPFLPPGIVRI